MLIYNQTTKSFLQRALLYLREICVELDIEFKTSRLKINSISYPLNLVVFEGDSRLGFYDHHSFRLGLNLKLIYCANSQVIRDILKHELAHFLTAVHYPNASSHGSEFRQICQAYGLPEHIAEPQIDIEQANQQYVDPKSERVIRQVQKLLSLASSNNQYEAELATAKANQLLLNHNLDLVKLRHSQNKIQDTYVHQVLSAKRNSAKLHAIYEILTAFYVSPVFHQGKGEVRLEVIGNRPSVELAEYVAQFLDRHLEELWEAARSANPKLKGTIAKNSFFRGVAQGHFERIKGQNAQVLGSELILLKSDLREQVKQVYSRLGSSSSRAQNCYDSHALGKKEGAKLSITPGLKNEGTAKKLLSFFKK